MQNHKSILSRAYRNDLPQFLSNMQHSVSYLSVTRHGVIGPGLLLSICYRSRLVREGTLWSSVGCEACQGKTKMEAVLYLKLLLKLFIGFGKLLNFYFCFVLFCFLIP